MPKRKINKKELQRPDQFVDFWTRASQSVSEFAAARRRAVIIGATALATVIIGSIVLAQVSERRSIRASEALDRVQRIEAADLILPGVPPKDDGLPHFGTEEERLLAALKELDDDFSSPRSALYREAMLERGSLLLDLDRAPEAAKVYEGLLNGKLDERLRFLAREGLGIAYERQGQLSEAETVYGKLGEDSGSTGFYADRVLYHQARLAELRGNPSDAQKLYKDVLEKYPATSLREEVNDRLASLELK